MRNNFFNISVIQRIQWVETYIVFKRGCNNVDLRLLTVYFSMRNYLIRKTEDRAWIVFEFSIILIAYKTVSRCLN